MPFPKIQIKDISARLIQAMIGSVLVTLLATFWYFDYGFSLTDEGYLWYGTQRVLQGEVPVRDFMAYDPGRYYILSFVMALLGTDDLAHLRWSSTIFQVVALFLSMLVINMSSHRLNVKYGIFSIVILAIWMTPYYKLGDFFCSLLLLSSFSLLVHKPDKNIYFLTGLCVGIMSILGRNHFVYAVFGGGCIALYLTIGRRTGIGLMQGLISGGGGVLAGFIPLVLMLIIVPGFASAYWQSILFPFQLGATNIALPVPWPWRIDVSGPFLVTINNFAIGVMFVAVLVFVPISIIGVLVQKIRYNSASPGVVSAAFLALPYAHYAYSRADSTHLSLGIFPLLIGTLTFLATQKNLLKWVLSITICMSSVLAVRIFEEPFFCRVSGRCTSIDVGDHNFIAFEGVQNDVHLLKRLVAEYADNDKQFIALPYWPGAYALFKRRAPLWEIYALFPRSSSFQRDEIKRIKAADPGFIVIADIPLSGLKSNMFQNTHHLTYQFFVDNFDAVFVPDYPLYQIFKKRRHVE